MRRARRTSSGSRREDTRPPPPQPRKPATATDVAGGALAGLKAAAVAGTGAAACVGLAHYFSPAFRRALGASGRTALVVTPAFGAFLLASQFHFIGRSPSSTAAQTGEVKPK